MFQIDHSIVESFGGLGKACITARVYPKLTVDGDTRLYIFNYGNESVEITGDVWSMKTAKMNWLIRSVRNGKWALGGGGEEERYRE